MEVVFEPTRSFCYKFGRYTVIPEIEAMAELATGVDFRLKDLAQLVINKYLTPEQQQIRLKKAHSEKTDAVHSIVKFFVSFITMEQELFVSQGKGIFRAKTEEDIDDDDVEEAALIDGDEEAAEFEGWVYAFTFPILQRQDAPFPIKIGKTLKDVEDRVAQQCKGSASFDNPVILGKWQVNRVGHTELAVHNVLKARGKWRENVPGVEWFDTTIGEIESILNFVRVT
ncbi:GIY-YIG nuclease family protein [Comamonas antarctica]|uniref:GIY-YIG nuclease family protein n=1 Tax=Comamonas antarctica TaxID=2743470 RepID=A0A6N1X1R7_9BURK|nr:GIY-YIG nuclease family protein [Comamonas antarctica]QKV53319.1 GIY-YIG nuclease family protein [Comamonas antarctica]